jgi:hypothetical protein
MEIGLLVVNTMSAKGAFAIEGKRKLLLQSSKSRRAFRGQQPNFLETDAKLRFGTAVQTL